MKISSYLKHYFNPFRNARGYSHTHLFKVLSLSLKDKSSVGVKRLVFTDSFVLTRNSFLLYLIIGMGHGDT